MADRRNKNIFGPFSSESEATSSASESEATSSASESEATSSASESAPTSLASESAPTSSVSGSAPTSSASKVAPTSSASKAAPTHSVSESAPTSSVSGSAPTSSASKVAPTSSASKAAPTHSVSESAPTSSASKAAPAPSIDLKIEDKEKKKIIGMAENTHIYQDVKGIYKKLKEIQDPEGYNEYNKKLNFVNSFIERFIQTREGQLKIKEIYKNLSRQDAYGMLNEIQTACENKLIKSANNSHVRKGFRKLRKLHEKLGIKELYYKYLNNYKEGKYDREELKGFKKVINDKFYEYISRCNFFSGMWKRLKAFCSIKNKLKILSQNLNSYEERYEKMQKKLVTATRTATEINIAKSSSESLYMPDLLCKLDNFVKKINGTENGGKRENTFSNRRSGSYSRSL